MTAGAAGPAALRHVLVVAGTLAEWDALGEQRWAERRRDLARVAAAAGAMWLTVRPYERGAVSAEPATQRMIALHDGCTIVVDPSPDGRERFLAAVEQLRDASVTVVDESAITGVLMAPAPVEPDLTVILGPSTQLPPSLVWELSYSEIVFVDAAWDDLAGAHVEAAITAYSQRHRRFGAIE
ncbi:unannotated protein [freshwater metagenome]|uniref:Unannotated protein n=1 Tax=freshwater metagenome TaxID=449393 RepID=A0A6J7E1Y7_9ZZZZ